MSNGRKMVGRVRLERTTNWLKANTLATEKTFLINSLQLESNVLSHQSVSNEDTPRPTYAPAICGSAASTSSELKAEFYHSPIEVESQPRALPSRRNRPIFCTSRGIG